MKKIRLFNKNQPNKFKNTFMTKNYLLVVVSIVLVVLATFLFLRFNYKEVFTIDIDGFMLSGESVDVLKDEDDNTTDQKLSVVKLKSNDSIYKNTFNYYVNDDRGKTVNVDYPLFVDNGFTIINYNSNVNLLDDSFERTVGYEKLVISYGKLYDSTDYTQIDQENYLLLSYQDGVFINLYDIKIETFSNTYNIPTNSFLFFFENSLNYFERDGNEFIKKNIIDLDDDSKITFYYEGLNESHKYTYEEVLIGTGTSYMELEMPDFSDIESGSQNTNPDQEGIDGDGEADTGTDTDAGWKRPTVISSSLRANVYSIEGSIQIDDPTGAIVSAPTYTLYVNNKIHSRRSFYGSGNILITGLSSETEYFIIGQYTYLDSDQETRKIVTFYTGSLTTNNRSSLGVVNLTHQVGDIYARKIVLNNVGITSSLQSEAIRGVYKAQIEINGENYPVSTRVLQQMLNGEKVTLETSESLVSNIEQNYKIIFYDRDDNILKLTNNTGTTRTSKKEPVVFLTQLESDNIHTKIEVDLRNDDNVEISDYKYTVFDSAGAVVAAEKITDEKFTISNLDPNQLFTLKVTGDVDLNNTKGVIDDYLLGEMEFSTLPVSNLGFVNLLVETDNVSSTSADLAIEINQEKTDAILLQILDEIIVSIYDAESEEFVDSKTLSGEKLEEVKANNKGIVTFNDLKSNSKYNIKISSLVVQGKTETELDCIYNLEEFVTRKKTAEVLIINSFVTSNMIDFDVMIDDSDGSILSKKAVVELRDEKENIVSTQVIDANTEDYIRITYDNLIEKHNYTLYFYANEYNETDLNADYVARYDLKKMQIFTDGGISGSIELVSSLRTAKSNNLVDVTSGTKWMQTLHQYNVPSTVDEDGDLHIYSKLGSSAYTYDLSDYYGKMVTATFKIKAVTPVSDTYRLYFSNSIAGTTNSNRGIELTNLSTDEWKSFTYTFVVGQEYVDSTLYKHVMENVYGENAANYAGFYITGGTAKLAEYEVRDFQIVDVTDNGDSFTYNKNLENKVWNQDKSTTLSTTYVATEDVITLEGGYYYDIRFNTNYGNILLWKNDGSWWKQTGDVQKAVTLYVAEDCQIALQLWNGNINIQASDVSFTIDKYKKKSVDTYEAYKYVLDTKVRVDLVDLRSEITNRDYFIKVYENDKEVKSYNYVELEGIDRITDVIKEVELEENKNYKIELGIKIRDRYYALSSFNISTAAEVVGISTVEEWSMIQPHGSYILLNDLDFKGYTDQSWSFGTRYFYGSIDFQGYSMNIYTSDTTFTRIGRLEKGALLKNLVLNVYLDHTTDTSNERGFIDTNYGSIENVNINLYNSAKSNLKLSEFSSLCNINQRTGIIRNFTVNLTNSIYLYENSALLVKDNYGTIKNGYVYGDGDLVASPEVSSGTARDVSFIQKYGGSRSVVEKVFVLPSLKFLTGNKNWDNGGLIAYESSGEVNNSYVVGTINDNILTNGPAVYNTLDTFSSKKLYYLNDYTYANDYHQRISSKTLNDVKFQNSVLGNAFVVSELVTLGYYPQVIYSSDVMPAQPYLDLPEVIEDNLIDITYTEVIEQTNNSAVVEFYVSNPEGEDIVEIVISDLDVEILEQSYSDGTSVVRASLTNPKNFVSKYQIRSIKSAVADYESKREYSAGEKFIDVSFYIEISTVNDWIDINVGLNQNYIIMNDIDFFGYNNVTIGNFNGKLEGNNYTLSNIDVVGSDGVFNQMNGVLQNIRFENINKYTESTNAGLVGYSNKNAVYENVHVKNINVESSSDKTSDNFFAGGLVGQMSGGSISNCSVTNVNINSIIEINNVSVGGLVGYASGIKVTNSYAQDVNLVVTNSKSTYGVGGLIGRESLATGSIKNCYATGTIENNSYYSGGLVGYGTGAIERSYSVVNIVNTLNYAGGITGYSADNKLLLNNLYVGNVFSSNDSIGRITASGIVSVSNYGFASGLVNGVISDITNGEALVTYDELLIPGTYSDVILLGEGYNYSKVSEAVLPKLYYLDTEELLPNQNDNKLYQDKFSILDVSIDEYDEYGDHADITLSLSNPDNHIITGIEIEHMDVEILNNVTTEGISVIKIKATPKYYLDSYRLSKINYKEVETDKKSKSFDKNYKLDMTFYRKISSYEDWQKISTTVAENCLLMNDIDFTDEEDINTGVLINNFKTLNDQFYTLKGIEVLNDVDGNYISLIKKVQTSIKNIGFEDIDITDTTNISNKYVNVIESIYGEVDNLSFKTISIDAPNEDYVAIVGKSYGTSVTNVTLEDVTINGRNYVAGYIGAVENASGEIYSDITGKELNITGSEKYVGGLFATMSAEAYNSVSASNFTVSDSSISGGSYVGGIVGSGGVYNSSISNSEITGESYVGGLIGKQVMEIIRYNKVNNCEISGSKYYIGGIVGSASSIYEGIVMDSTITSENIDTYGVGGTAGLMNGFNIVECAILNTTITGSGYDHGGIAGENIGGTLDKNYVENCTISGNKNVGGVVGYEIGGSVRFTHVTSSLINSVSEHSGGLIGYVDKRLSSDDRMLENYVTDTKIVGERYAGGFIGGFGTSMLTSNELYFEGSVTSKTSGTVGLAVGNKVSQGLLNSDNVYVYENSVVNGEKVIDLLETGADSVFGAKTLNYQELRNKLIWTATAGDDTSALNKLNFTSHYYDWEQLQYKIPAFTTSDLSGNGNNGLVNISAINNNGIVFATDDNNIVVSNYQPTSQFSISTNITYYRHSSDYRDHYIFASMDANSNGYGIYLTENKLYVRINDQEYLGGTVPYLEPTNITATYGSDKILKIYINGVLSKEHVVNLDIASENAITMIAPADVNFEKFTFSFTGAMKNIEVFDRVISSTEVLNNYKLDSITNSEGLRIYYDFGDLKYESGVGHYPIKLDVYYSSMQTPTELPYGDNRDYGAATTQGKVINLVDSKLEDIHDLYASGVNTINLEFDDIYDDVSFSYKYGEFESDIVKAEKQVYSLTYDFKSDLEITIKTASSVKVFKYTADEVARKLYVSNNNYYHINNNVLYMNGDQVIDNVVHVYDGLVLTNEYKVYDIKTKSVLNSILPEGVLSKEIPLYESTVSNTNIKTYYNYSRVVDGEGNVVLRDGQLVVKDSKMYVFDASDSVKQEMNLFNTYNTDEYQVSLNDGMLVALKSSLNYPGYFNNSEIVEVSYDKTSDKTVMLIRYSNDYIYAFDYYTGDELYSYGTKLNTSLFKFILDGFSSSDNLASSSDSYNESKTLLGQLDELTNQEVIDKLNPSNDDSTTDEGYSDKPNTNSNQGTNNPFEELAAQYIQVYNYDTNSYEVYSVSELLNSEKEKITSETNKIKNDTFLYNYFYEKTNTLDSVVKVIIYVVIIGLVLINLVAFAKYLSRKEVKNNG